jgi:Cu+-exporting ATPase
MVANVHSLTDLPTAPAQTGQSAAGHVCFHCGTNCANNRFELAGHRFCCQGCLAVYELLAENGLTDFYSLDRNPGIRVQTPKLEAKYKFLDEPSVRQKMVQYSDEQSTRATFVLPAIHCIACVWLLENLFRLKSGIGSSQVNFSRKELSLAFDPRVLKLSEVVTLIASLGYEPDFKLSDLENKPRAATDRTLWTQLGVAGFAFGNNMLFSIALYLGVDAVNGPAFQQLVGYLSLLLAVPVLLYSSRDYFRMAINGLKQRVLTIEVPIATGILVIFGQSSWEVLSGNGHGYFDSFAGLIFFLLCGRLFQQKTYDRLAFDRDYRSFFPLSVTRKSGDRQESISLSELQTEDRLVIRHGELIPADASLYQGTALIDYSFVTGESEPVRKRVGEYLYAGGRQMGGAIEVITRKPVSQSYLTSLWNQDAFSKDKRETLDTLINRYSQRFTISILAIALGSGIFWAFINPSLALKAFASVLIVACPCALALAAPFTLGAGIRIFGRNQIYIKNSQVIEELARTNSIVFDKTGTLTGSGEIEFEGDELSPDEQKLILSLARHSTHPHSIRIAEFVTPSDSDSTVSASAEKVTSFQEVPGRGTQGVVLGTPLALGNLEWLRSLGIQELPRSICAMKSGSTVQLAINGLYRGGFRIENCLRDNVETLIATLKPNYKLSLLSGDNERQRTEFEKVLGKEARFGFNQSPNSKLEFIQKLQASGERVMMVGDGLNDAGALQQSNVGVAVVEKIGAFSPASDIIIPAHAISKLGAMMRYAKSCERIVRLSFLLSAVYNLIGIGIAVQGLLSPIVCAILMPLSSISVVAFACAAAAWSARRQGLNQFLDQP